MTANWPNGKDLSNFPYFNPWRTGSTSCALSGPSESPRSVHVPARRISTSRRTSDHSATRVRDTAARTIVRGSVPGARSQAPRVWRPIGEPRHSAQMGGPIAFNDGQQTGHLGEHGFVGHILGNEVFKTLTCGLEPVVSTLNFESINAALQQN